MAARFFTIFLTAAILLQFGLAAVASAGTFDTILKGFKDTGTNAGYDVVGQGKPKKEFIVAFSDYISGFLIIIGAGFFIMIIYAGFLWMWAKGNEDQVERAKKMILTALIGLGIIIAGRLIAEVVFSILSPAAGIVDTTEEL